MPEIVCKKAETVRKKAEIVRKKAEMVRKKAETVCKTARGNCKTKMNAKSYNFHFSQIKWKYVKIPDSEACFVS